MTKVAVIAAALAAALIAGACASDGGGEADRPREAEREGKNELNVQVASYDLAAGTPTRVIVGLLTQDEEFVSYGNVDMEFFFLSKDKPSGTAQEGPTATGTFLPIPGEVADPSQPGPKAVPASKGRGVYQGEVTFDRAGFWAVQVTADLVDGGTAVGSNAFEVLEENKVPVPGERAPKTENLTLSSDAPQGAVDSRAASGKIPDPELHRTTIADSIDKGTPAVLVFSTPVFCVSRFCGPITDMVAELAADYSRKANFIHVEIWRDFQEKAVNKAAAEWLLHDQDLQEPWVFVVGGDGRIVARWDNVATRGEIEPVLKEL